MYNADFNKEVRVGTTTKAEGRLHGVSYNYISKVQQVIVDEDAGVISIIYKGQHLTTIGKREVVQVANYFTKSSGADTYVCELIFV